MVGGEGGCRWCLNLTIANRKKSNNPTYCRRLEKKENEFLEKPRIKKTTMAGPLRGCSDACRRREGGATIAKGGKWANANGGGGESKKQKTVISTSEKYVCWHEECTGRPGSFAQTFDQIEGEGTRFVGKRPEGRRSVGKKRPPPIKKLNRSK